MESFTLTFILHKQAMFPTCTGNTNSYIYLSVAEYVFAACVLKESHLLSEEVVEETGPCLLPLLKYSQFVSQSRTQLLCNVVQPQMGLCGVWQEYNMRSYYTR